MISGSTGTVTFYDGTDVLGRAEISGTNAALTISNFAVGSHGVTATYSGGTNFAIAVSNLVTVTITPSVMADYVV